MIDIVMFVANSSLWVMTPNQIVSTSAIMCMLLQSVQCTPPLVLGGSESSPVGGTALVCLLATSHTIVLRPATHVIDDKCMVLPNDTSIV